MDNPTHSETGGGETIASRDIKAVLEQFVDYLMPELTAYEACLYLFLLRNSLVKDNVLDIRIGKRTIAANLITPSKGVKGDKPAFAQITKLLKGLEE
ncbi:MAG: hypothetical protein Q7T04_06975, partial [Dehalococcoidia bacterium]|nr:hypothetical protein [Dehalococcoidia bacterium]